MDQSDFEKGNLGVVVMKSYRIQLAYYFGDLNLARVIMDELRPHSNSFVAPFFQVTRRFFFALIRMGLARKAPEKERAALLKKIVKEDIAWLELRVRGGAINCLHKLLILKAEAATFGSDLDAIKKAFGEAIMTVSRVGFTQDAALANEIAASFFLSAGEFQWASDYMPRACELYDEWGAQGKVKQMQEKYVIIKTESSVTAQNGRRRVSRNKSHKGKQRFSDKSSNFHKQIEVSTAHSNLVSTFQSKETAEARVA